MILDAKVLAYYLEEWIQFMIAVRDISENFTLEFTEDAISRIFNVHEAGMLRIHCVIHHNQQIMSKICLAFIVVLRKLKKILMLD